MVRVAGLKGQQLQSLNAYSNDGMTIGQQLAALTESTRELMASQQECWLSLREEMKTVGIQVLNIDEINGEDAEILENHFGNRFSGFDTASA